MAKLQALTTVVDIVVEGAPTTGEAPTTKASAAVAIEEGAEDMAPTSALVQGKSLMIFQQ
jgi:hypothetical protein